MVSHNFAGLRSLLSERSGDLFEAVEKTSHTLVASRLSRSHQVFVSCGTADPMT